MLAWSLVEHGKCGMQTIGKFDRDLHTWNLETRMTSVNIFQCAMEMSGKTLDRKITGPYLYVTMNTWNDNLPVKQP